MWWLHLSLFSRDNLVCIYIHLKRVFGAKSLTHGVKPSLTRFPSRSLHRGKHEIGTIDSFRSSHRSSSGEVVLAYPQAWEGMIKAKSNSGSLRVRGKDVKEILHTELPGHHQLEAMKGLGGSKLNVATASGSVKILVGDE